LVKELRNLLDDMEDGGDHRYLSGHTTSTGIATDSCSSSHWLSDQEGISSSYSGMGSPHLSTVSSTCAPDTCFPTSPSCSPQRQRLGMQQRQPRLSVPADLSPPRAPLPLSPSRASTGNLPNRQRTSPSITPLSLHGSAAPVVSSVSLSQKAREQVSLSPQKTKTARMHAISPTMAAPTRGTTGIANLRPLSPSPSVVGGQAGPSRTVSPRRLVCRPVAITNVYNVLSWE
jgi:hypothetical protein